MSWDISLFERLVGNHVDMQMLKQQRRMRWEISRLLLPVYGDGLGNAENFDTCPQVPGMGGVNSWFFDHAFPEDKDEFMSTINREEAAMIVEFAAYLALNGVAPNRISVLTFYKGQKSTIISATRSHGYFAGLGYNALRVYTVDSYQGEENDIIILSTVRNNTYGSVGFVGNPNRVNVALSRARLGLYVFGSRQLLTEHGGQLWGDVFDILDNCGHGDTTLPNPAAPNKGPEIRIDDYLPLKCECGVPGHDDDRLACRTSCMRGHEPTTTRVRSARDFYGLDGGCTSKCVERLGCGHQCPFKCHP